MNSENKNVFFSIIVPVYNVEIYLVQCLESILKQVYNGFEIILVNDGSTDSSLEICTQYQRNSTKIKLINKENGGLSEARNVGLRAAQGEYIIFTDSDDYWEGIHILSDLNSLINQSKPDIILHEESRYFSDTFVKQKNNCNYLKQQSGSFEEDALQLIYYDLYVACAWDKIIRKAILLENDLYFPIGKKSEDIDWCGKLIYHIKTYSIYNKSFYRYRQTRKDSITATVSDKHIMDVYEMVKEGLHKAGSIPSVLQKPIFNYWACNYVVLLKDFYVLTPQNQKKIWKDLVSWKFLLQKNQNIKIDKVMRFYTVLPFWALPFFLNIYRIKTKYYKQFLSLK